MSDLILHHYPLSPFAQKARMVLGFKGLAWRSVTIPVVLPKPDVLALTGGYRRTPFMQIGADVYCDTALICRVLEGLQPTPSLYPAAVAGLADIVAQWADTSFWWTAVPYTLQPAGAVHLLPDSSPEAMKAFGADRAAMNPNMRRATLTDGAAVTRTYLTRLEHLLSDGRPFLLGALPCIADFSAAQVIWFILHAGPVAQILDDYPKVRHWQAQIEAFGQGNATPMTSAEAIAVAAAGARVPLSFTPEAGLDAGDDVTVTPTDYAYDPVAGQLVGLGPNEVVIARTDERAGTVHVHFPRIAFQIKKLKTS